MIRIQAIHFINRLAAEVSKELMNKNLMEVVLGLADDAVPNIRFNVCKSIDSFYSKMTPGNKIKSEQVLSKLSNDSDFDCQFFARQAMAKANKS